MTAVNYKDRIFVTTFIGVMSYVLGFVSVPQIPERELAVSISIVLGIGAISSLAIGTALHKGDERRSKAEAWSLAVIGVPAIIFVLFSFMFARQTSGSSQGFGVLSLWMLVLVLRAAMKETNGVAMTNANAKLAAGVAALGAVVTSVLTSLDVINGRAFVLVVCNLTIACVLGFVATGSAKNLLRLRYRTTRNS